MKTIVKRIGIKVYNLKNGPFWKAGWCNSRKAGAKHCVGLCQNQIPWKK